MSLQTNSVMDRENRVPTEGHPRLPTMKDYYEQSSKTVSTQHSADLHVQKSGLLYIQINNNKKMSVRAKVYNNRLDHYILFSSKAISNSTQKFVNLKHTHVEQVGGNSIRIIPNKDIEGQSLLLLVPNENDVSSWLEVLTPLDISSPALLRRHPLMPTLQESDEE